MISCIKSFLFVALFCVSVSTIYAQDTYYYKQTKVVRGGKEQPASNGGQFISFYKDICYESNHKGITVSHGNLDLDRTAKGNLKVYTGDSYWGRATFKFSADLQRLNVVASDGTIYVYNRQEPPKGVTTCSLIKSNKPTTSNASGVSSGWYTTPTYMPTPQPTMPAVQPAQDGGSDNAYWANYYRSAYQSYQRIIENHERTINTLQGDNGAIQQAGIVQSKMRIREAKQKQAELQREAMQKGITIP